MTPARRAAVWACAAVALLGSALTVAAWGAGDDSVGGGSGASAGGAQLTPVLQSVPSQPRWFRGDDGAFHVEYELVLTNAVPLPVKVTSLQVLGPGGRQMIDLDVPLEAADETT